jgi:hypothetical protein
MRRNVIRGVALAILTVSAGLTMEASLQAGPGKGAAANNQASSASGSSQSSQTSGAVATLTSAHKLLMDADHDYDGHRHHAAVAVGKALKALGSPPAEMDSVRTRHERQAASDAQLAQAKQLLQSALSELQANKPSAQKGRGQKGAGAAKKGQGAAKHVQVAIEAIGTALSIK